DVPGSRTDYGDNGRTGPGGAGEGYRLRRQDAAVSPAATAQSRAGTGRTGGRARRRSGRNTRRLSAADRRGGGGKPLRNTSLDRTAGPGELCLLSRASARTVAAEVDPVARSTDNRALVDNCGAVRGPSPSGLCPRGT